MKLLFALLLAITITSTSFAKNHNNALTQGEVTLTIDGQTQTWLSKATVLSKNLGKQVQKALNSPKGDAIKQQAKDKVKQAVPNSGDVKVKNSDAVDFAKSLEGKTLYASQGRAIAGDVYLTLSFTHQQQQFNINVNVNNALDATKAKFESAVLTPDVNAPFNAYDSKTVSGKIDNIQRINDNAIAISGSVNVKDLAYKDLMKQKKIDGKPDIKSLTATFTLSFVPIK